MYYQNKIWMGKNENPIFLFPQMANRHGLIAGATGTGKTISTIFPAVKVMGEGRSDKIFYLTANRELTVKECRG